MPEPSRIPVLDRISPKMADTIFYERMLETTSWKRYLRTSSLTVAFSAGPTTQAPAAATPGTLTVNFPTAAVGEDSQVRIVSGAVDVTYYFADTDLMDGRTYLGAGLKAESTVTADIYAAASVDFAGVLNLTNNNGQIVFTTVATGASATVTVTGGVDWTGDLTTVSGTGVGANATSDTPSTITITTTGGVSRAFTWAWSDPGSVTYMGQGNTGALSARNALVTAINAYGPFAGLLTAAASGAQSFTLTTTSADFDAYVTATESGVDIFTGTGTGTDAYEWGAAHPETSKFPDHKLVAIKPDDEPGWVRVYYAATRASQEDYNYEIDNVGRDMWPSCLQTWVLLRSEGVPNITTLATPPTFSGAFTWTRMNRMVKRTGDPITDSLFVIVEVEYWDVTQPIYNYDFDQLTRLMVTETRTIVASNSTPTQSSSVVTQTDLGNGYAIRITFTSAGTSPASQETYNFEEDDVGPERWPECVSTWVIPRASYTGLSMSVTAPTAHGKTWTKMWSQQVRTGDELMDQLYVVLRVIYWDKSTDITEYEEEETLRCIVTITRSIVASSSAPTVAQYSNVRQSYLGNLWSLRTTRTINGGTLPTGWTQKQPVDFTVPALLTDIDTAIYTDDEGRDNIQITPIIRSGVRKKLDGKLTVAFHTSDPTQPTTLELYPTDPLYNGITFNISGWPSVITDGWTISNTGPVVAEDANIAESTPSYTDYLLLIGDEVTIAFTATRLPTGIWMSETLTAIIE